MIRFQAQKLRGPNERISKTSARSKTAETIETPFVPWKPWCTTSVGFASCGDVFTGLTRGQRPTDVNNLALFGSWAM